MLAMQKQQFCRIFSLVLHRPILIVLQIASAQQELSKTHFLIETERTQKKRRIVRMDCDRASQKKFLSFQISAPQNRGLELGSTKC